MNLRTGDTAGTWKRLKKSRLAIASACYLAFLVCVALFAPCISGKPAEKKSFFPIIPYDSNQSDFDNADYTGPFDTQVRISPEGVTEPLTGLDKHLLGTGRRGEDVLSGIIHGTRVSLAAGFISMAIAGMIGILLGAIAGYFGDYQIRISRGRMFGIIIGLFPALFYGFIVPANYLTTHVPFIARFIICVLITLFVLFLFWKASGLVDHRISFLRKKIYLPVDNIISRFMEILTSLPLLILIITIAAISRPSFVNLVLIIGFTSWTEIARLTRAETLKVRELEFVQSARGMAFSEFRILVYHVLPNAVTPALVALTFGIASAILIESGLSFLGVGVPPETATWGSLLAKGREQFNAWWLVVFPGLAIFSTVVALNVLGEKLREAMNPR